MISNVIREDLNTYVSKCQAKWEECYAKYENLPGFQEVRQKQRTLIEVEIKLKSKLLHIDEITQELDQLKIRQST